MALVCGTSRLRQGYSLACSDPLPPIKSYCTICGAAIPPAPSNVVLKWPSLAVLLHNEDEPSTDGHITELHARNLVDQTYKIDDVVKPVFASPFAYPGPWLFTQPLYIPCHLQCLYIAKRAISTKRADPLRYLWTVLHSRIRSLTATFSPPPGPCSKPHRGYFHETVRWAIRLIDEDVEEKAMYEADPLNIPGMTPSICKHFEEVPASDLATMKQLGGIPTLPQEITDLIWQHLCPLSDPPITCTRLFSPEQWHYALRDLPVLPWLWNIDTHELDTKEQTRSNERCWDWESLIRRLATRDAYSFECELNHDLHGRTWNLDLNGRTWIKVTRSIEGLSPGLRNRRRIWEIAIDMLEDFNN